MLDGTDSNYRNRRLAVYQASDNRHPSQNNAHGLDGIGNAYSFFKVEPPITLESLRQCLIDRDVRIRQPHEYSPTSVPSIQRLTINGEFFPDSTMHFHPGLNSIIGSKGSGKSLLVECLRFVLAQPPTESESLSDHNSKLETRLGMYGTVELEFIDDTGNQVVVSRTYDPANNHPITGVANSASISRAFPVLFLSQNEIIRLATNDREQLGFIDKFFDFHFFTDAITQLEQQINVIDSELSSSLQAFKQHNEYNNDKQDISTELEEIAKSLKSEVHTQYSKALQKNQYAELIAQQIDSFEKILQTTEQDILNVEFPEIPHKLKKDQLSKQLIDLAHSLKNSLQAEIEEVLINTQKKQKEISSKINTWDSSYKLTQHSYENFIREKGGDTKALEAKRQKLQKRKETIEKSMVRLKGEINKIKDLNAKRDELLEELGKKHNEYYRARLDRCEKFSDDSNKRLQVTVEQASNKRAFVDKLKDLSTGTRINKSLITQLAESSPPMDFIRAIIRYDLTEDEDYLQPVTDISEIPLHKVVSLANNILEKNNYEDILRLAYSVPPEDQPEIRYHIGNNQYELIEDVSVGQKCTAMLLMALSEGNVPIIIDQPEDSLDLRSIWEDICSRLRVDKEQRQFIFTTHNSSIAVASDSDHFLVIEANAHQGNIQSSGTIDSESIRSEVITYLEGGEETYKHKSSKYNVNSSHSSSK